MINARQVRNVALLTSGIFLVGCLVIAWAFGSLGLDRDRLMILQYLEDNLENPVDLEAIEWTEMGEYEAEVYEWDMARRGRPIHAETLASFQSVPTRLIRLVFRVGAEPRRYEYDWVFAIRQNSMVSHADTANRPESLFRMNDKELFDYLRARQYAKSIAASPR